MQRLDMNSLGGAFYGNQDCSGDTASLGGIQFDAGDFHEKRFERVQRSQKGESENEENKEKGLEAEDE